MLYRAISALVVAFGQETPIGGSMLINDVPVLLRRAPKETWRRFAPGLADLTDYFALTASVSEDAGIKDRLVASMNFKRSTAPADPSNRGFRQNSWMVAYMVKGNDLSDMEITAKLKGARRYAPPPFEIDGRKLPADELFRLQLKDKFSDSRTTRLFIPPGLVQPPISALEVGELTTFAEKGLLAYRSAKEDLPILPTIPPQQS